MKFISNGIHSRLYYVLRKAGGIDKVVRRDWFKTKFGFDDETIDIVLMYDIEKLLTENTIEEIKDYISRKNKNEKLKSEKSFREFLQITNTINRMCCNSNMFQLGDRFRY